jgi:hypothetical protein
MIAHHTTVRDRNRVSQFGFDANKRRLPWRGVLPALMQMIGVLEQLRIGERRRFIVVRQVNHRLGIGYQ